MMRGENFVAHLDGLGGTPVAHHCFIIKHRLRFYCALTLSVLRTRFLAHKYQPLQFCISNVDERNSCFIFVKLNNLSRFIDGSHVCVGQRKGDIFRSQIKQGYFFLSLTLSFG
jgi:hypothetical protein